MTPLQQFTVLLNPAAIATAIGSGIAFGLVIRHLRLGSDPRLITYLAVVLGVLWFASQAAQLLALSMFDDDAVAPWATLGRLTLYLGGFVVPMWMTLKWRNR